MMKKAYLFLAFFSGFVFAFPGAGDCSGITRTFDFYANLFDDGQSVWVQLQYYEKFGEHYKVIAYSPVQITIHNRRYEIAIPDRYCKKGYYLEIVFDIGYVTPKISLYPLSDYLPQTTYILLGALFIAIVSRIRFNRWTQKNIGKYTFPPRSFTTWPRFVRSALMYVMVIEIFYSVIIYFPGVVIFIDKYLGGGYLDYEVFQNMGKYSVLWSIFLLTGVLPNFPWVSKWETSLRDMLHDYAFIPSEAKAVISQLNINYTAFKPDGKIIERILPKIGTNTFSRDDFTNVGNMIAHKWCKLSYLKYRLVDWMTYPSINKFFTLSKSDFQNFLSEYDRVKSEVDEYFGYIHAHNSGSEEADDLNGLLNATRTKLHAEIDTSLNNVYTFICIGILGTEKMPGGRKRAFRFFGLAPFIPERSNIDWDASIKTIAVLVSAVFLPTLLYYIMSKNGYLNATINHFPHSANEALFWSMMGIVMHSLTIILVVFFDQWRTRVLTSMYDEEKIDETSLPHKLSYDVIAAIIGFSVGFLIMGCMVILQHPGELDAAASVFVKKMHKFALWATLPAVTGFFIQYYLHTFRTQRWKDWQLGLFQGSFMSVVAAIASFLVIDKNISEILHFILYAAFTSFCVGTGIGYMFTHSYLKKMKRHVSTENGRRHNRANVMEPATIYVNGSRYACNLLNLSAEGAKIDRAFRYPGGHQIQIRAANFGELNSIIVRKERKGTIVRFPYLDEATQNRITAYLDKYSA